MKPKEQVRYSFRVLIGRVLLYGILQKPSETQFSITVDMPISQPYNDGMRKFTLNQAACMFRPIKHVSLY